MLAERSNRRKCRMSELENEIIARFPLGQPSIIGEPADGMRSLPEAGDRAIFLCVGRVPDLVMISRLGRPGLIVTSHGEGCHDFVGCCFTPAKGIPEARAIILSW